MSRPVWIFHCPTLPRRDIPDLPPRDSPRGEAPPPRPQPAMRYRLVGSSPRTRVLSRIPRAPVPSRRAAAQWRSSPQSRRTAPKGLALPILGSVDAARPQAPGPARRSGSSPRSAIALETLPWLHSPRTGHSGPPAARPAPNLLPPRRIPSPRCSPLAAARSRGSRGSRRRIAGEAGSGSESNCHLEDFNVALFPTSPPASRLQRNGEERALCSGKDSKSPA